MTIIVTDQSDRPISPSDLPRLALWNETISHICATAMARTQEDTHPLNKVR